MRRYSRKPTSDSSQSSEQHGRSGAEPAWDPWRAAKTENAPEEQAQEAAELILVDGRKMEQDRRRISRPVLIGGGIAVVGAVAGATLALSLNGGSDESGDDRAAHLAISKFGPQSQENAGETPSSVKNGPSALELAATAVPASPMASRGTDLSSDPAATPESSDPAASPHATSVGGSAPRNASGTTGGTADTGPTVSSTKKADNGGNSPAVKPSVPPVSQGTTTVMNSTYRISSGHSVQTNRIRLVMQTNGNLVITDSTGKQLWSAGTTGAGNWASFQDDGNFVVYNAAGTALWSTGTGGHPTAIMYLQQDGNVTIVSGSTTLWSSGTII